MELRTNDEASLKMMSRSRRGIGHRSTVLAGRTALIKSKAAMRALINQSLGPTGVEEPQARHDLEEKCKKFLRSTDDLAVASLVYPGGVRELVKAREMTVALLVRLMLSEDQPR